MLTLKCHDNSAGSLEIKIQFQQAMPLPKKHSDAAHISNGFWVEIWSEKCTLIRTHDRAIRLKRLPAHITPEKTI